MASSRMCSPTVPEESVAVRCSIHEGHTVERSLPQREVLEPINYNVSMMAYTVDGARCVTTEIKPAPGSNDNLTNNYNYTRSLKCLNLNGKSIVNGGNLINADKENAGATNGITDRQGPLNSIGLESGGSNIGQQNVTNGQGFLTTKQVMTGQLHVLTPEEINKRFFQLSDHKDTGNLNFLQQAVTNGDCPQTSQYRTTEDLNILQHAVTKPFSPSTFQIHASDYGGDISFISEENLNHECSRFQELMDREPSPTELECYEKLEHLLFPSNPQESHMVIDSDGDDFLIMENVLSQPNEAETMFDVDTHVEDQVNDKGIASNVDASFDPANEVPIYTVDFNEAHINKVAHAMDSDNNEEDQLNDMDVISDEDALSDPTNEAPMNTAEFNEPQINEAAQAMDADSNEDGVIKELDLMQRSILESGIYKEFDCGGVCFHLSLNH